MKEPATSPAAKNPPQGDRTYVCHVTDKETDKPIAGASVLVRISLFNDPVTGKQRILEETRQTTDKEGSYRITITREQAAERSLYVYIDVNHPGYLKDYGGYGYGMSLKNEKLGERPFFENVKLRPGKAIEGTLLTPEGAPASGVNINAFCAPPNLRLEGHESGSFTWTKTAADGRFRLDLLPKGQAVFWVLPKDHALETHVLKNDMRGELGTITLKKGNAIQGKVLDTQGKPVGGVYVTGSRERSKELEELTEARHVSDHIVRTVVTSVDGSFTIRALPAGPYTVNVSERSWDPATREDVDEAEKRPLPGVFTAQKLTIVESQSVEPIVFRGLPHVIVEAQIYDSKGNKARGHEADIFGKIDGNFWNGRSEPTKEGRYRWLAPHGLEEAQVNFMTNEHTTLRVRKSKSEPLSDSQAVQLGTLDHDVKGIEIVRYVAPILVVTVATKNGSQPADATVSATYSTKQARAGGRRILKGGEVSDCGFEEQEDGRFRSENLAPDEKFTVTAKAKGYSRSSATLSLPEGATKEIELTLETENR